MGISHLTVTLLSQIMSNKTEVVYIIVEYNLLC